MTDHLLDGDADESSYFARQNKNGKAAYRRALLAATGSLPIWAMTLRKVATLKVVTQDTKVVTQQVVTLKVVTLDDAESDRLQPGYVDPLTLIDAMA